jgi:hypothetical protein
MKIIKLRVNRRFVHFKFLVGVTPFQRGRSSRGETLKHGDEPSNSIKETSLSAEKTVSFSRKDLLYHGVGIQLISI